MRFYIVEKGRTSVLGLLNEYKKLDVELYILHFDLHTLSARMGNLGKVRKILLWILSKGN